MPAAVGVEDLFARVEDLHGPPGHHRELRDTELEIEGLGFAAEGAADRRLDHPHLRHVEVEHPRQLPVQIVGDLGGRPDRELAGGIEVADGAVGLDRRVRRALEEVLAFDHDVRLGHQRVHVAELEAHVLRQVAVLARLPRLVDRRLRMRQRLLRVEKIGKRLVHDVDQLQRFVGRVLVHRRHRRHAITDVADLVHAERILVSRPGDDAVQHRHVAPRHHRAHTLQRQSFRRVDRLDPRVRMRAPQDLRVQHPRQRDVVGVDGAAGGLGQTVGPPQSSADHLELALQRRPQLFLARRARGLLPAKVFQLHLRSNSTAGRFARSDCAASSTAS